ncbi:MAG: aquaporin [Synechococcales bacterium]|nr:aquaporin [Synechococcales bacterium]
MLKALREHWVEYLIEAWGLGTLMVMAGLFATLIHSPVSLVPQWLPNSFLRGALMGVLMGLTAIALIYSPWGKRSGAHLNPGVTLTFFRLKKLAPWDVAFYILAQFVGGTLGVALVAFILREAFTNPPINYLATVPGQWGWWAALVAEFLMAFGLMMTVLVTANHKRLAAFTGIFAGLLVATYITLAAPISGMSINPARTFASALPSKIWTAFWIYYFAPPLAMLTAAEVYRRVSGLKTRSICCKLCPNGETDCISIDCCDACDDFVRPWR